MPEWKVNFTVDRSVSKAALDAEIAQYKMAAKEADIAAKAAAKSDKDAAEQRKAAAKAIGDEQKKQAKETATAQKAAAKEVADAQKIANAEMSAGLGTAKSLMGVLSNVTGVTFGLGAIAQGANFVSQAFADAKRQAIEAGDFVKAYRDSLKELAFLKGQPGATSQVVRADLEFRKKTLQDQQGARSVQEGFRNVAGVSIDTKDTKRRISQEDAEAAMVYAGQFQAMTGASGDAVGKLAGIIPSTEKKDRVTADDVKRRLYQLSLIGQAGGASPGTFADAMAGSSYLTTTGAYKDFARQAAVASTLSIATPDKIPTRLEEVNRLTKGGLVDQSKPMGAETSPAAYLKSIGATDQMDTVEILQKMFRDVERAEAESAKKGETLDLGGYLNSKGYGNIQDKAAFGQLYGSRSDLENSMMGMANKIPTAAEAEAGFNQFKGTVQGIGQQAAVDADRNKFATGGGSMEYYKSLQQRAYDSLGKDAWGSIDDYRNAGWTDPRRGVLDQRAQEILRSEGTKAGLDYKVKGGSANASGMGGTSFEDPLADLLYGQSGGSTRAEAFYKRAQEIATKGGDPLGGNSDLVKEMNTTLQRMADTADRQEDALRNLLKRAEPAPVAVVKPGGANAGPIR